MKRKKQRRLLLILLVLLLALCVGYFFLLRYNKEQENSDTEETDASISIYPEDFDSSAISSISYQYDGTALEFSLQSDGETWQYDDNKDFPLNQSSLSGMNSQLQSLTASRKIKDNLDDLADYGLDQPSNAVTAKDSDGTECTIYFGNTNDSAGVTYVYTDADQNIYTIDSGVADYFSHPLLDMIVEDELPLPDSTAVYKNMTIERGKSTLTFQYKENGDTDLDYLKRCAWFGDIDGDRFAMDDTAVSELTDALDSLSTSGCAAYDISVDEMSVYGLDDPTAVITVNYTQTETVEAETTEDETSENESSEISGTKDSNDDAESETETEEATEEETETQTVKVPYKLTLKIGKAVGDYYYVTWNDLSQVYLMSASSLESFLNCDKSTLAYMEPFHFTVNDLEEMTITCDGRTYQYQIKQTTEEVESTDEDGNTTTEEQEVTKYTLNGDEIDSGDFTNVLGTIQDTAAEKLYPEDAEDNSSSAPSGSDSVTIQVKFSRSERSEVTLVLTPYDSSYYALYVDGTPAYLMNKMDIAGFIKALPTEEE
ncbi:MAG: DUF4340 domain-containing protein [Lachnospiraceae bacterium]|nr:DUF4340 domain-containing protein [Lachnospiraceae bacterium]